jgi:hypothetical protein
MLFHLVQAAVVVGGLTLIPATAARAKPEL